MTHAHLEQGLSSLRHAALKLKLSQQRLQFFSSNKFERFGYMSVLLPSNVAQQIEKKYEQRVLGAPLVAPRSLRQQLVVKSGCMSMY